MKKYLTLLMLAGCGGGSEYVPPGGVDVSTQIARIQGKIDELALVADSIQAVVDSPYADCSTADSLLDTICSVAQAAAVEGDTEVLLSLANLAQELNNKIAADRIDLAEHAAAIALANDNIATNSGSIAANAAAIASAQLRLDTLEDDVDTLTARVDDLETRMDTAEAAIDALEAITASIGGTLNSVMVALSIGEENNLAGPIYESVLRRNDKKRITGYVLSYGTYQSLGNNPVSATNGNATVTVTATAHGYSVGNVVELDGLTSGRGFLTGDLKGKFVIQTVPTANTFTIVLARNATSTGTLGGTIGVVRKFNGEGMSTLWKSDDASDSAVRTTTAGSMPYNFIIRRIASDVTNDTAELCYDSTNRSATFATINAAPEGGSGNIVCK